MSDLRQTAIDAILEDLTFDSVKELRAYVSKNKQDDYFYGGILHAINAVQDLPSAQPETCPMVTEGGYCNLAERRIDG